MGGNPAQAGRGAASATPGAQQVGASPAKHVSHVGPFLGPGRPHLLKRSVSPSSLRNSISIQNHPIFHSETSRNPQLQNVVSPEMFHFSSRNSPCASSNTPHLQQHRRSLSRLHLRPENAPLLGNVAPSPEMCLSISKNTSNPEVPYFISKNTSVSSSKTFQFQMCSTLSPEMSFSRLPKCPVPSSEMPLLQQCCPAPLQKRRIQLQKCWACF